MTKRFVNRPHSALIVGTVTAATIMVAIFVFGAPPLILVPVSLAVATAYSMVDSRVNHRLDRG